MVKLSDLIVGQGRVYHKILASADKLAVCYQLLWELVLDDCFME